MSKSYSKTLADSFKKDIRVEFAEEVNSIIAQNHTLSIPRAKQTEILAKIEDERARKRAYYHANKKKIKARQKASRLEKVKVKCNDAELPLVLAEDIRFNKPVGNGSERYSLRFNSKPELINFLINIKKAEEFSENDLRELHDKFARENPEDD